MPHDRTLISCVVSFRGIGALPTELGLLKALATLSAHNNKLSGVSRYCRQAVMLVVRKR